MSEERLIQINRLSVGYSRPILQGIDLRLARGSFTAILGANGSGKTTLLKTIAGILPPLAGDISFQPINGAPPAVGYVPQRESLDPVFLLSSLDVVLMGTYGRIRAGRFPGRQARELALECLRASEADDLAAASFSRLSGGQKQRVLIARALATRPDLLLLDEPTAGIDTATARSIMELLSRLHRERGLTVLHVTHDLPSVRKHAQQVIWLHEGRITQGVTSELLSPERIAELLEVF